MDSALDTLFTLLAFVLMISAIVTIHEFGHYRSARWFGLIGSQFSIGFGKRLFGWTDKNGTDWRVAPILIGGYVRFPGENDEELKPGQKSLKMLPRWQRAIVVAAGPLVNLVFAAVLFAGIAYSYGYPTGRPVVVQIEARSPAEAVGIQVNDVITDINRTSVTDSADVIRRIKLYPGKTMEIGFERNGEPHRVTATLENRAYHDGAGNTGKIGYLGIQMPTKIERAPNIGAAITQGVSDGIFSGYAQIVAIKQIFTGDRQILEMSGPVRIAKMSSRTLSMGLMPFLYMMGMLSIAVGMMNLLPIPGLDGGYLAAYAVETVMGRDIPVTLAQTLLKIGVIVIICLGALGLTLDLVALS